MLIKFIAMFEYTTSSAQAKWYPSNPSFQVPSLPPSLSLHHGSSAVPLHPLLLSSLFERQQVDLLVQMLRSVICLSLSLSVCVMCNVLGKEKMGLSLYTCSVLERNVSDLYKMPCHTGLELVQIFTRGRGLSEGK